MTKPEFDPAIWASKRLRSKHGLSQRNNPRKCPTCGRKYLPGDLALISAAILQVEPTCAECIVPHENQ